MNVPPWIKGHIDALIARPDVNIRDSISRRVAAIVAGHRGNYDQEIVEALLAELERRRTEQRSSGET